MTKRHFEELAHHLRTEYRDRPVALREVARSLASFCARQNSRFDRDRFLAACGVEVTAA